MKIRPKFFIRSLLELIFPEICVACGEHLTSKERVLCASCTFQLPQTRYHFMADNPVEEIFWGRVPIEHATAYCYFVKGGRLQRMLHALKYHKRQDVGLVMGELLGQALTGSTYYKNIDFIVAVPLHPKKERIRGFNQSDCIAEGISSMMDVPCGKPIERIVFNPSQTRKGRYARWENVKGIFKADKSSDWHNKHFLLIDDVMTTGSTLEAAAYALNQISGARVSLAVIGLA